MTGIDFLSFPRFWSKVSVTGISRCWFWKASLRRAGDGQFKYNGKMIAAHRLSYELLVGVIPKGLELDHLCRNRSCVNPYHLEPVTHLENMRRGIGGWNSSIKIHCPRGHMYTTENTYIYNLWRHCRICNRLRMRKKRRKALGTPN